MRWLISSRLIWIYTVCKCVSEFTLCPNLPDFTLLHVYMYYTFLKDLKLLFVKHHRIFVLFIFIYLFFYSYYLFLGAGGGGLVRYINVSVYSHQGKIQLIYNELSTDENSQKYENCAYLHLLHILYILRFCNSKVYF